MNRPKPARSGWPQVYFCLREIWQHMHLVLELNVMDLSAVLLVNEPAVTNRRLVVSCAVSAYGPKITSSGAQV